MRMVGRKTEQEIYEETRDGIIASTPLVDVEQTSVLGGLISAFSKKVAELHDVMSTNYLARFARTAFGTNLDALLEDRQLTRITQFTTNVSCDAKVLALRTTDGATIASKLANPSNQFYVIPAGTIITSSTNPTIVFSTNETAYITSTDRVVYLGASAELEDRQTVAAGTLDRIELSEVDAFVGADMGTIELIQSANIVGVQQVETDAQARQRYYDWTTTAAKANDTALTAEILSHPEVATIAIQRFIRGTGSAEIIAVPVNKRLSKSAISQLQGVVNRNASFGENATVVEPDYVPVNMVVRVYSTGDRSAAIDVIENYVANIGLGGSISYGSLKRALQDEDINSEVLSMNVDGQTILPTRTVSLLENELFDLDISVNETTESTLTPIKVIVG